MRNKLMKNVFIGVALMSMLVMPLVVSAAVDVGGFESKTAGYEGAKTEAGGQGISVNRSFLDIVAAAGRWIMSILAAISVVMFIVAGIMYVTAAGNEEQVEKAKKIITYAIIGLVIALVGFLITEVVRGIAGQVDAV